MAKRAKTKPARFEGAGEGLVVGENTVVTLNFIIRNDEDGVLDDMVAKSPFKFVFGQGDLPPALEEGIAGLASAQSKTIVVASERAYGQRDKDLVIRVPRSRLPSKDCVVGTRFLATRECPVPLFLKERVCSASSDETLRTERRGREGN